LVKVVLRLSRLAKIAAGVAGAGGLLAVYGRLEGVAWASDAGTVMLLLGAIVYFIERLRMRGRRPDG